MIMLPDERKDFYSVLNDSAYSLIINRGTGIDQHFHDFQICALTRFEFQSIVQQCFSAAVLFVEVHKIFFVFQRFFQTGDIVVFNH